LPIAKPAPLLAPRFMQALLDGTGLLVRGCALAGALALSGCATSDRLAAAPDARFDPASWFTGRSHGDGTLHKLFSSPVRTSVDSIGRSDGAGGLVLDQTIRERDKPVRTRQWVMRPAGPNHFTGTLTEATGPVDVTISGPRATIRYAMKGGLHVDQELALQADGTTLLNRLTVTKLGLEVAHLDETIRKAG